MFGFPGRFISKNRHLFSRFSTHFSSSSSSTPIQVRYSASGYTNIVIALPHQSQKIFFLNDKFTFKALKEMFQIESPLSKIDIIYPSSLLLKDESNVLKFLKSQDNNDSVLVLIDGHEFKLSNDSSFETNRILAKVMKKAENNRNSVLYWYQFCIENKIPKSNIGTIAYFMKILNSHIEKQGFERNLTKSEIEELFKRVLGEFGCPVNQKLEQILEKNNEIESEILNLEKVKEEIEENAKRRMVLYQKLILLISLAQLVSFYYMIFHVEWLGWDIIEPITYTISQLTLVFGIRFFWKYGKKRDLAVMQDIFMNKIINNNRAIKDKYKDVSLHIFEKRMQKKTIEWQMELLKNSRTYNQFLKA